MRDVARGGERASLQEKGRANRPVVRRDKEAAGRVQMDPTIARVIASVSTGEKPIIGPRC